MNVVFVMHSLFVFYVLLVPIFSVSIQLLGLHVALLVCIIVHWRLNNDVCFLTFVEQQLYPEKAKEDLFVQRLVGPVYNVTNHDIKRVTYALLLFTAVKLSLL